MGMNTGLRFKAKLNEFGIKQVEYLMKYYTWSPDTPEIWLREDRKDTIPFGMVWYMPYDWKNTNTLCDDTWEVCCSLKNYNCEINTFLVHVLPGMLAELCSGEVLYEEDKSPLKVEVQPKI